MKWILIIVWLTTKIGPWGETRYEATASSSSEHDSLAACNIADSMVRGKAKNAIPVMTICVPKGEPPD